MSRTEAATSRDSSVSDGPRGSGPRRIAQPRRGELSYVKHPDLRSARGVSRLYRPEQAALAKQAIVKCDLAGVARWLGIEPIPESSMRSHTGPAPHGSPRASARTG